MLHCRTVDDARSRLMSIERLSLQISKETLVSGQPLYSGVMRTVLCHAANKQSALANA